MCVYVYMYVYYRFFTLLNVLELLPCYQFLHLAVTDFGKWINFNEKQSLKICAFSWSAKLTRDIHIPFLV